MSTDGPRLRVMTYNVGTLHGDLDALSTVVQAQAPDVLLVQEAPRYLRWRSKRAALARRCGLVVATTDRPGGLCILTALRVDLQTTSFVVTPRASGEPQRAVVSATVSLLGTRWCLATTQPAAAARRPARVQELWTSPAAEGTALVLGGHVGEGPDATILADPSVIVESCTVIDDQLTARASHHRPVIAVLHRAP